MKRECDFCGNEFAAPKNARSRFCSSKCALEDRAAKTPPKTEHLSELERFMAQPEISQLRAGIQTAIRTAWTRCFEGVEDGRV